MDDLAADLFDDYQDECCESGVAALAFDEFLLLCHWIVTGQVAGENTVQ